jgi:hypothetical protein
MTFLANSDEFCSQKFRNQLAQVLAAIMASKLTPKSKFQRAFRAIKASLGAAQ